MPTGARWWLVAGALLFLAGALGVWLSLRLRAGNPEPPGGAPTGGQSPRVLVAHPQVSLVCPTCQEEQAPPSRFCPYDGNRLVPGPVAGPLGGICPTCHRGFDPGVTVCPEHDEDLQPRGLLADGSSEEEEGLALPRICPACGTSHTGGARFCERDGVRLESVN